MSEGLPSGRLGRTPAEEGLQGPGKGVNTTQIPERTQSMQGKLSAEVCEVGLLLKVGAGAVGKRPQSRPVELDGP